MYLTHSLLLVVTLFSLSTAQSICKPNHLCLTQQYQKILDRLVLGVPDLKSLEPLWLDLMLGNTSEFNYAFSNIILTGLKDCQVQQMAINPKDLTFEYILKSPQFVIIADYKVKGTVDSHPIHHEGSFQTKFDNYTVTIKGTDNAYYDRKDNKTRLYVKDFHIDDETFNQVKLDSISVREADREKANLVLTSFETEWGSPYRTIPNPLMENIWNIYMLQLNAYLKEYPDDSISE